jgi:hypothetical protein
MSSCIIRIVAPTTEFDSRKGRLARMIFWRGQRSRRPRRVLAVDPDGKLAVRERSIRRESRGLMS